MKIALTLAGALLLAGALTACGGDSDSGSGGKDSDYCKDVKNASKQFDGANLTDGAKIEQAFATLHQLADEAPGAIKDDWQKIDAAITKVEQAFKDAGLKLEDLANVQGNELPEGVDVAKLAKVGAEFQKLTSEEYTKPAESIDAHAKKVCNVTFSVS